MYAKVLVTIVALAATAALLLGLRQQRYELANEMVVTHRRMQETRRSIWTLQADLAGRVQPRALEHAIAQSQLPMEPVMPMPAVGGAGASRGTALARGQH